MLISFKKYVECCNSGTDLPAGSASIIYLSAIAPQYNAVAVFPPPSSVEITAFISLPKYFSISLKATTCGTSSRRGNPSYFFLSSSVKGEIAPQEYGVATRSSSSSSLKSTSTNSLFCFNAASIFFIPSIRLPPPPVPSIAQPINISTKSCLSNFLIFVLLMSSN
ncbi:hypothetical protein SDC9_128375 [bioreactor metagenome]|uniref:Uncharacterized protein n=1 Tax=bioreactor metagenome TaxID=1076179 RepID=A0A645CWS3_9ZZZZ